MLWLCIHLPALPLEGLSPAAERPVAVVDPAGNRRRLIGVSRAAAARGIQAGMEASAALALVPDLRLLPRNPLAEAQMLETTACWLYGLGTPVTLDTPAFNAWVEVSRSLRLFGGWPALRKRVEQGLKALGCSACYAVGPSLAAAALLARATATQTPGKPPLKPPVLTRSGDILLYIRNWPLELLRFDEAVTAVLRGSGLRRIGEVVALPRDALGRRFGPQVPLLLERLLGRATEAWEAFQPPAVYRRRLELAGSAETTEALLFPLRKMLGDFVLYLRARDVAVQGFRLRFIDLGRRELSLDIGLLGASRELARLLPVVRERLEHLSLTEPVLELWLEADRFEPATASQPDLFQPGGTQGESMQALQERLLARLGEGRVRRLAVVADHRPERGWSALTLEQPAAQAEPADGAATDARPPRPLWLLPQPKPIPLPRLLGPPERIECGWWEGRHQTRDYHLAEDGAGRRLWVYRELGSSEWRLHGLWE